MKTIKELADLIESNPNCEFVIDNDSWCMINPDYNSDEDQLASSDEYEDGEWYSSGSNYGGSLAAAMVELLNRKGFQIKARAC